MRRYSLKTGLPPEAEEAIKSLIGVSVEGDRIVFSINGIRIAELTADAILGAVAPNTLSLGDHENYLHSITVANVIIPSRPETKKNIRSLSADDAPPLPDVIEYERAEGKGGREVGFDSETAPDLVKTPEGGIDLKAVLALLALHLVRLERRLEQISS
jgi:hypothetical protein